MIQIQQNSIVVCKSYILISQTIQKRMVVNTVHRQSNIISFQEMMSCFAPFRCALCTCIDLYCSILKDGLIVQQKQQKSNKSLLRSNLTQCIYAQMNMKIIHLTASSKITDHLFSSITNNIRIFLTNICLYNSPKKHQLHLSLSKYKPNQHLNPSSIKQLKKLIIFNFTIFIISFILTMSNEKKLIIIFKNFVEKIFLPSFKKTDSQVLEWNRLSQYISTENINYEEVYQYVESINSNPTPAFEKRDIPLFKKKKEENQQPNSDGGFNPSKTFGGERARMMFVKGEMDDFGEQRRDVGSFNSFGMGSRAEDNSKRNFMVPAQSLLPGLQRLCKTFLQNQQRLENMFNNGTKSPTSKYG